MKILVDIDGIAADTLPYWLNYIHATTGVRASIHDITKWELAKCPPLDKLLPEKVYSILNNKGFMLSIPPMSGASETLEKLQAAGHQIYMVTARYGSEGMPETILWLKKHFQWLNPEKQLVFLYDKHLLYGDILIDDKAETLIKYSVAHPNATLLTIDYPYNRTPPVKGLIRVARNKDSWTNLGKYIEGLVENK